MFKSMVLGSALVLLSGCASWLEDRPAREPSPSVSSGAAAPAGSIEAEMRERLAQMRRRPDLASDALIRDLEAFLQERERARRAAPAVAAPAVPAAPAVAAPVAPAVPAVKPAPAAPTQLAVVRPASPAVVPAATPPLDVAEPLTGGDAEMLFARARALEGQRQVARALPLYADASRQGMMAASVRLMELYTAGADGVARNYVAAVRFKDLALQQGAKLEYHNKR